MVDDINISDGTVMNKVYDSPDKILSSIKKRSTFHIQDQHLKIDEEVTKPSKLFQPQQSYQIHDSDKEFFKLTLLSIQLNHKNFNLVKTIDTNFLYELSQSENI